MPCSSFFYLDTLLKIIYYIRQFVGTNITYLCYTEIVRGGFENEKGGNIFSFRFS